MNELLLEFTDEWEYIFFYNLERLMDEIPRMTYVQVKSECEQLFRIIPSCYSCNCYALTKLIKENFQYDQQYQIDKIARTYYINI